MLNYIKGTGVAWKDIYIQGIKSQYKVSNEGDVKNKITGKSLDQYSDERGHLMVKLENKDKIHRIRVQQLVARAFIPNPAGWLCVRHKDKNKMNNHVNNLEWDTSRGWM